MAPTGGTSLDPTTRAPEADHQSTPHSDNSSSASHTRTPPGYRRIHGELHRLGHQLAASTVWKVLRACINATRDRTGPAWSDFIRSQSKAIIATDFACIDTALFKRFHVLFVIEHATRRIHLGGITTNPTAPWTTQAARNLTMRLGDVIGFGSWFATEPDNSPDPSTPSLQSGSCVYIWSPSFAEPDA
jgi:hypothetical protein